jgi:hypothetical protein
VARTLFRNGLVLEPNGQCSTAVAIADGVVVAVGQEALDGGGAVVDLGGGLLVAGLRDGHCHPLWGGMDLAALPLDHLETVDGIVAAVGAYAAAHPELGWVEGGPYQASALPGGRGDAAWLDQVVPERPVVLSANDYHTLWVNSAALARAGIDATTPDPSDGRILRRADGSPSGMLVEWGAMALVARHLPPPDPARRQRGLDLGLAHLVGHGVVWAQEAAARPDDALAYLAAAAEGRLPLRVNLAWRADPATWRADASTFGELTARIAAEPAAQGRLSANTVKFFADGVIEQGTGYLLEPYEDEPHSCGLPNWTPAELAEAVGAFDAAGYQIHIHAIGDGGVRMALDALATARAANVARDRRPVIAHTQLVDPADRPRFAELGVVANFEPLWAQLEPGMTELTVPRLGPRRTMLQYPIGTLHRLGASISFGSDWPVSSADPLAGLAVAVTRQTPGGEPAGGWLPEERLPILQALAAYTSGVAHQAFDDDRGTIAVGQRADLTLIDSDITALAGIEVPEATVQGVWVDGVEVWRA